MSNEIGERKSNRSPVGSDAVENKRLAAEGDRKSGMKLGAYLRVFAVGLFLGIVFVKSEVANWNRIHKMFLFEEAHLYLIISVGILVAMISMAILRALHAKSMDGNPIKYSPKPFNPGVIWGGMIFGAGWAITGACPGPIYAQIGAGEIYAWLTFGGAMHRSRLSQAEIAIMAPPKVSHA